MFALIQGASELTFERFVLRLRMRYFAEGVKHAMPSIPSYLGRPLSQVIKATAQLDFHREDESQHGVVRLYIGNDILNMHVTAQPTDCGEQLLMRFEPAEALAQASKQAERVFRQLFDWSPDADPLQEPNETEPV